MSDELFKRLELELELPPDTTVLYEGALIACHGLWIVHAHIDDTRVLLRSPTNEWQRLNANKSDLTVVPGAT